MSREESILSEEVSSELLEDKTITVRIVDGDSIKYEYELATELKNPFEFDASRFLPNVTPMTLPRFFDIASQLISNAQSREGLSEDAKIRLIEEYPPEPFHEYGDEIVAYRVLRREPANMSSKGTSRPQRKSTYYYDLVSPTYPNKVIIVESRPVDHLIEFSCWAKSNKLANARALWLEKLFINHSWAFEVNGVERFFWKDRGPDTYMQSGGQRLFYRPVNFFVRFREFEVKAHPMLKQIEFAVGLTTQDSTLSDSFSDT